MKTLIIEDELFNYKRLKKLILGEYPDWIVDGPVECIEDMRGYIDKHGMPDLMFADIRISDGIVFDLFDELCVSVPIIFTTAYNEYAVKAFRYNAIHYLLKPIDPAELKDALTKLMDGPKVYPNSKDLKCLVDSNPHRHRFLVQRRDETVIVKSDDVSVISCEMEGTILTTTSGDRFTMEGSLDKIQEELDPKRFFRANRQTIINIDFISKIVQMFGGKSKVYLSQSMGLPISMSRKSTKQLRDLLESI